MSKIPFRIYRLKRNKDSKNGFSKIAPDNYLLDIRESDIASGGKASTTDKLRIVPSNIPGYTGTTFEYRDMNVYGPDEYGRYIKLNNKRYYIMLTEPKGDDEGSFAIPNVFEFYLDPQHVTPQYRKLQTEIRTRGGWEVQHWGEALTEVRVEGKSGGLHQLYPGKSLGKEDDVTQSLAWIRLNQLKTLYDSDHNVKNQEDTVLLGMNFYDKYFVGYFTDFNGPEASSETPYIVNFSFNFKVQQEISVDLAISNGLINI